MSSLCFKEAAQAKDRNEISTPTYLNHLLAHLRGTRHTNDDKNDPDDLSMIDPISASIKRIILSPDFKTVEDTTLPEHLLQACTSGPLSAVKPLHQQLKKTAKDNDHHPLPSLLQPMAVTAAAYAQIEVLNYCIQEGAVVDSDVNNASTMRRQGDSMRMSQDAPEEEVQGPILVPGSETRDMEQRALRDYGILC
ncbi:MAG: hypothetical protein Q9164_006589, partial [Protoblastenia rupestris]